MIVFPHFGEKYFISRKKTWTEDAISQENQNQREQEKKKISVYQSPKGSSTDGAPLCVVCPLPSAGKHGEICERKSQKNRSSSEELLYQWLIEFAVQVPIKVQHALLVRVSYKIRIWLRVTFWLTLTVNSMRQCVLATNPPHTHDLRAGVFETFLFCCG